jgi:hypothetical protein
MITIQMTLVKGLLNDIAERSWAPNYPGVHSQFDPAALIGTKPQELRPKIGWVQSTR